MPFFAAFTAAEAITAAEVAAETAAAIEAAQVAAAAEAAAAAAGTASTAAAIAPAAEGIMAAAPGIAETASTMTPEMVQAAAVGQPAGIAGIEGASAMTPAQAEYLQAATANTTNTGVAGQGMLPANTPTFTLPETTYTPFEADYPVSEVLQAPAGVANSATPLVTDAGNAIGTNPYQLGGTGQTGGIRAASTPYSSGFGLSPSTTATSGLQASPTATLGGPTQPSFFEQASEYADKNPFKTGAAMYMGAGMLGLLDPPKQDFGKAPYSGSLTKYRMSPDFQGSTATPNVYRPAYPSYAVGGIMDAGAAQGMNINPVQAMSDQNDMLGYQQAAQATGGQVAHFAKGGNLADSLDYYKSMMESRGTAPAEKSDVGIYRDTNMSTRNEDALAAAQIRNAQVAKRANMQLPAGTGQLARPTPMGQLNLRPPGTKADAGSAAVDTENAAAGGIMGASSLGGYAAGGNPRLLKGPGDGMSDNIPAVIGQRQPARLADGEFVIPADVVSHLGNGSTEAGAKRLHEMMNKVRKERTGNSKQGKQIVASKYMPK
jgi:hypothetical protein